MAVKKNMFFPIDSTDTEESNLDAFILLADCGGVATISEAKEMNKMHGMDDHGVIKITISAEIVKEAK